MRLVRAVVLGGASSGESSKHSSATFVQGFRLVHAHERWLCQCSVHSAVLDRIDFKVAVVSLVKEACCVPLPLVSPFLGVYASCVLHEYSIYFLFISPLPLSLQVSLSLYLSPGSAVRPTPSSCALPLKPARVLAPCKGVKSHPRGQICHLFLALIVYI